MTITKTNFKKFNLLNNLITAIGGTFLILFFPVGIFFSSLVLGSFLLLSGFILMINGLELNIKLNNYNYNKLN